MKQAKTIWLAATTAVWLAGCATRVTPPAKQAEVAAPAHWSTNVAAVENAPPAARWTILDDDRELLALVREAWEHNRDLAVAASNLDLARAQARIAGADRGPSVGVGLEAERAGRLHDTGPQDTFTLGLNLSWEADLWGRVRDLAGAANARVVASEADYAAAHLSLAGEVARLWYDLRAAKARLALNEETARNLRSNLEIVERRYDAGLRTGLDLRLARTEARAAESAASAGRQEVDALTRALETLVGRYPAGLLESAEALPELPVIPEVGLPAEMVAARPDLRAAEARYAAAAREAGAARKLRLPRLSLTAGVGTASNEFSDLLDRDFGVWNLVGGLTAPIFQSGRIAGQVDLAKAGEEQALERYAALLLNAYREVETALAAEKLLAEQADLRRGDVTETAELEELAWSQYRRGVVDIVTVLETQRRAFSARSALINLQNQRLRNRLDLLLALGAEPRIAAENP